MLGRRDFGKLTLSALPWMALPRGLARPMEPLLDVHSMLTTSISGVRVGFESWSVITLPHDGVQDVLVQLTGEMGLGECALYEVLILPSDLVDNLNKAKDTSSGSTASTEQQAAVEAANEAVTHWRTTAPLDYFVNIRKKFDAAGIDLYAYTPSVLTPDSSEEVLERTCLVSRALGVKVVVNAMPRSVAKRFAPFAEKYDLKVGFQGHPNASSKDPDAIAAPADYQEAVAYSKKFGILLDIGDATAGGIDVLQFVKENHEHIYILNLKDRRKKDRVSMPWGEGDTPVKEILLLVRDNKYRIRCYVDCDYETVPGSTRAADCKRCLAFCKQVLTS